MNVKKNTISVCRLPPTKKVKENTSTRWNLKNLNRKAAPVTLTIIIQVQIMAESFFRVGVKVNDDM